MLIVLVVLASLVGVSVYVFRVVVLVSYGSISRGGVNVSLESAVDRMTRTLRTAYAALSTTGACEIRFTIVENGADVNYAYYLYNPTGSYRIFDTTKKYELRQAAFTGTLASGTFTYGSGRVLLVNVLPPPVSDLSISGANAIIDLSVRTGDETVRSKTQVFPRDTYIVPVY